jgi:hypothetical protein
VQLGIVVRDLEATVRRYVDDYGIGPWQFAQIDLSDTNNYGGRDFLLDALGDYGTDRSVDVLSGGPGNDQLIAWSGAGPMDLLSCGGGFDRVVADKGIDRVPGDCEKVFWSPQG